VCVMVMVLGRAAHLFSGSWSAVSVVGRGRGIALVGWLWWCRSHSSVQAPSWEFPAGVDQSVGSIGGQVHLDHVFVIMMEDTSYDNLLC